MRFEVGIKKIIIVCSILILAFACAIPFWFESSSMFYKVGIARLMLRSGKICGILAGGLLTFQAIFAARIGLMETLFGPAKLRQWHQINGAVIPFFAVCHPVLILWADDFAFFPFQKRYWPEFLGMAVLLLLLAMTLTAFFRRRMNLNWKSWFLGHRITALLVFSGVWVHASHVSQSFESGYPFILISAAGLAAVACLIFRSIKIR